MKEIFREYGGAVIAAFVALAILFFFQNASVGNHKGVAQIVGHAMEQEASGVLSGKKDNTAFEEYQKTASVQISYDYGSPAYAGEKICLSGCFDVLPTERQGSLLVIGVCDSKGNTYPVTVSDSKSYVTLPQAGIYQVYLEAEGANGKKQRKLLSLPVMSTKGDDI